MHMPAGPHQAPILSCDPGEQLAGLWRALAPERWPLDPSLLPRDSLLVGGAVRDALLGRLRDRPDLDLVVAEDAIALARSLARRCGGSCVVLDPERSIARLVLRGWSFDLARRMGASLDEDLARRDYSINAIALPLATRPAADAASPAGPTETAGASELALQRQPPAAPSHTDLASGPIDPGGGLEDLRARRLRALGEANLLEDPLRLLRGVRLACELGFSIEAQTLAWIRAHQRRLIEVAGERVLAELERLADAPAGAEGLIQALDLGLLSGWQPQPPPGDQPGLARLTPEQARRCGLDPTEAQRALSLARLAAVLSPAGLTWLHASRRLQQRCRRLRQWRHCLAAARSTGAEAAAALTLSALPEAERLALQQELEEDLPALLLHLQPDEARQALARWRDDSDPLFHPRPPLDGTRLQEALALPPGRTLGLLLAHLTHERAFGRLAGPDEAQQALQAAQAWLASRGETADGGGRRD